MEILKYKEFEGSAELDMTRKTCRGKILYIDDVVTYESKSIGELQKEFEEAVNDYIETCKQIGKEPQKSCRGQFNVRVSPELHRAATRRAIAEDKSLNDVVCKALEAYLAPTKASATTQTKILGKSGSTTTTVRRIQNPFTRQTRPKQYYSATGSVVPISPEKQEQHYDD